MRLVHRHTFINALPKNSCFLLSAFCFTVTLSPSEIQSPCVVHKCTSLCSLFQTALCSLFPPQAAVARLPQVLSFFLLQFVIAVTASDGDCYLSNFRPRQCGLFIIILSSTLSLKTVHRTVFLTVAFKSRHRLLVQIKRGLIFYINPLLMVRVTGLEPVRRETHAPQTCLSAYSSTLAFISHFFVSSIDYTVKL